MIKFSTLARGVVAGVLCMFAWGGSAHAVLLSEIYAAQTSGGTIAAPTLTVGDITFTFKSCGGTACTGPNSGTVFSPIYNDPSFADNFEVVGVLASPSTGPGGGIMVRAITSNPSNPLLAVGSAQGTEVSLSWDATSSNSIIGAQGSATGNGVNVGGGGSTSITNPSSLGTVNMNPNLSDPSVIAFAAQTSISGAGDYTISAGSLQTSTVYLSQVPEPISLSLLLTGLIGLGCIRHRHAH